MMSQNVKDKQSKPVKRRIIHIVLSMLVSFTVALKREAIDNLFSSGTSGLIGAMTDSSKNEFLSSSSELNELIKMTKDDENNPLRYSASHRSKISDKYVKMAGILENELYDVTFKSLKMGVYAKEMITGLETASLKVKDEKSALLEIEPNSIGLIKFGTSEFINSMSIESRKKILSESGKINSLIEELNKSRNPDGLASSSKYPNSGITDEKLQEISKMYKALSITLSDDLHNIQINNPRMAILAKNMIRNYQVVSKNVLISDMNLPKIYLEDIRY